MTSCWRACLPALLLLACAPPKGAPRDSGDTALPDPNGIDDDPPLTAPDESSTGLAQLAALGVHNVIVVHADTMRADHLPMYGYDRQTTPNLFHKPFLAVRGWQATAPWTLPSTTSALTALTPEHHGNVAVSGGSGATGVEETLAEHFRDAGYATGAFSGNRVVSADPDLARGFDINLDISDLEDIEAQSAANLWDNGQAWLDSLDAAQPFFLWFQPMDTHAPYRPSKPFRGTFADYDEVPIDITGDSFEQEEAFMAAYEAATTDEERQAIRDATLDVYDELVLQEDDTLGEIFAWLDATGHSDDTLVVFTADHGETVADDGAATLSHMVSVRPELVNLPLAFFHPTLDSGFTNCVGSNIDLGPTLVRALGLDDFLAGDGYPIQEGCRDLAYSSLYLNDSAEDTLMWLSVMDADYKLDWDCLNGTSALYDLSADPTTLSPLDPASVELGPYYFAALESYLEGARATNPSLACSVTPIGTSGSELP